MTETAERPKQKKNTAAQDAAYHAAMTRLCAERGWPNLAEQHRLLWRDAGAPVMLWDVSRRRSVVAA